MTKPILYVDMDNVLVNFQTGIAKLDKETRLKYQDNYDEVPHIFSKMEPVKGAIEAVNQLAEHYDIYALSTAPWNNPTAWSDKIEWIQKHFGTVLYKRLILSHHKNLNKGDVLIDDRLKNGVEQFEGEHLHFGVEYKNWQEVTDYLLDKSTLDRIIETRSKKLCSELDFVLRKYEGAEKTFIYFDFEKNTEKSEGEMLQIHSFIECYIQDKSECLLFVIFTKYGKIYLLINHKKQEIFNELVIKLKKIYSDKFINYLKFPNDFTSSLHQFSVFNEINPISEPIKIYGYESCAPYIPKTVMATWAKRTIYERIERKLSKVE